MKTASAILLCLALAGCSQEPSFTMLSATASPTAEMAAADALLQDACPSLTDRRGDFQVQPATSGGSLDAEREFGAHDTVVFTLVVNDAVDPPARGHHCSYEIAQAPAKGMITSKTACAMLCDAQGEPTDYLVRRL